MSEIIQQIETQICKNCRFYLHVAQGVGDCAYYPPVIVAIGRQELPTVGDNSFCGKFKASHEFIKKTLVMKMPCLHDLGPDEVWERIDD